jgi:hypothetical protein
LLSSFGLQSGNKNPFITAILNLMENENQEKRSNGKSLPLNWGLHNPKLTEANFIDGKRKKPVISEGQANPPLEPQFMQNDPPHDYFEND